MIHHYRLHHSRVVFFFYPARDEDLGAIIYDADIYFYDTATRGNVLPLSYQR